MAKAGAFSLTAKENGRSRANPVAAIDLTKSDYAPSDLSSFTAS